MSRRRVETRILKSRLMQMRHQTPSNLQYLNNFVFVRQSKTRKLRSACQTSCLTVAATKYTETGRELHLKHKKFDMTGNILYTVHSNSIF